MCYRKYFSSHIELNPVLNLKADIDHFLNTVESAFATAALTSTPQTAQAPYIQKNRKKRVLFFKYFDCL